MSFFSKHEYQFKKTCIPPVLKIKAPEKKPKESTKFKWEHPQYLLDIECYPNYFLMKFLRTCDNHTVIFERTKEKEINRKFVKMLLEKYEIITFNGRDYDIPMLKYALTGATNRSLMQLSNALLKGNKTVWDLEEEFEIPDLEIKHVDTIELLPGIVSLKIYGARLHCRKMQELPIAPNTILTEEDMDVVEEYCGNDLAVTKLITKHITPQLELRRSMSEKYNTDLMSKSDAQIAEAVISNELYKIQRRKLKKREIESSSFLYEVPEFIRFKNPLLQKALHIVTTQKFQIKYNGKIKMPKELEDLRVKMGNSIYNMGMGGLHSTEKTSFHLSDDVVSLYDFDVSSYYPRIILNCELYPKQLGRDFLKVFGTIVEERLIAKAAKDHVKAGTLKIVVNGSFGKFGSPYSILYAPELMIQVTVTGQLSLLMLIEMMEERGISVISGNTDGIVVKCAKNQTEAMKRVIHRWQHITKFEMEEARYLGLFSRDVNNYIAIKDDGSVKRKGYFRPPDLDKNPENEICSEAMIEYIKHGTPFKQTIEGCKDIRKFLMVRSVKGGAVMNGVSLGKAIRWYHSRNVKGAIKYKGSGNKVPLSEGAKPLMELPNKLPDDIDYDWYLNACYSLFDRKQKK